MATMMKTYDVNVSINGGKVNTKPKTNTMSFNILVSLQDNSITEKVSQKKWLISLPLQKANLDIKVIVRQLARKPLIQEPNSSWKHDLPFILVT